VIQVILADITTLRLDAIVDAANPTLAGGGGVDGAIHRAAGPELARAATRFAPLEPGGAVITPGFALPARFVIHVVGPIWRGGTQWEAETLRRAYEAAFALAVEHGVRSIAFPAISTGVYGFPKEEAAAIALDAMRRHEHDVERIVACLFDEESLAIYRRLHDGTPPA
jgi:O-acetyl-ADP-ribose deacetylase